MGASRQKSNSYLANQEAGLTIYDAPNVCRDLMDKCQLLAKHADPEVVKIANAMYDDAKRMLDAIVGSVDQLVELAT